MNHSDTTMDAQEYEEVVETSFMCGECFLLFPSTEDFNAHQCQVSEVDKVDHIQADPVEASHSSTANVNVQPSTQYVHIETWEAGESEAAMEEAVASILGERMKRTTVQEHPTSVTVTQLQDGAEEGEAEVGVPIIRDPQVTPLMDDTPADTQHMETDTQVEAVEIPTTNLYMFDNPVYLNRLMKDNTFGRRVRHDAPYSQRLGPWDNISSRLLIQLLGEYPRAYFILDKECKRTEAWEMIRIKLAEAGCQFTVLQIRMRWRELCKNYRNTVNHNDMFQTGKTCQFFDELNELFGVWDQPATLLLIRQLEVNGGKPLGQNGGTRMRIKVWEHIRQVLASNGYSFTADQVQGRWSNLVTLYQRMVEHNSKPHNEPITIAFKDHIERIFNYVPERNSKWLKIMEKRGKTPKALTKKWTQAVERKLLNYYHERVNRFNNDHIDNNTLWKEIVQKLGEEDWYSTTIEKVRTRFYELTKQYSLVEQHNSQPGTIRRECKHHDLLTKIYNVYNFWPHDRSTIKMEKTNTIRMRQVNAQMMWSEEQSRTLLQLYPQILVSHISNGDHQPIEELWLQLAKAYMNAVNDRKACYEIEEHVALLRRGYHSQNSFPFVSEMQLVEETESTLGFVPEVASIPSEQLVSYWSHRAAHLLLDLVIHHRQEGVKTSWLFETISQDLADYGYGYTGEECRLYYSLLRQLYTNRLRTLKRNRELVKPFPYMDKMTEVDAIVLQSRFVETPESCQVVLNAACSKLDELKTEEGDVHRYDVQAWLSNLKMFLKHSESINPPPSIKCLSRILVEAIEDDSRDPNLEECFAVLNTHLHLLKSIAGKETSDVENTNVNKGKGRKGGSRSAPQPKCRNFQWTEKNLRTMLRVVGEWKLLCHDSAEVEMMLGSGMPIWKEVASSINDHYRLDPNKCHERFTQLCREYKSVMTFNARLGKGEALHKAVMCQELLDDIMSLNAFHDALLDVRDGWWASDKTISWGQNETLDLIFTVRELWTGEPDVNWDLVKELMTGCGYEHTAEDCKEIFQYLYKGYQSVIEHNQHCSMKTRRRPPFYYKFNDLFGSLDVIAAPVKELNEEICLDKTKVWPVLVTFLKKIKVHYCHSVPRRPLLVLLAQHLNEYFQCSPAFDFCNVWKLMVDLHHVHLNAAEQNTPVQDDINLEDLWQNNTRPLVAYGLHAVPLPGWEQVCGWSVEEVHLLMEGAVTCVLQPARSEQKGKQFEVVASQLLSAHGYEKTPLQCEEQWRYIISTFPRGGYEQFQDQLSLIHLLSPSRILPRSFSNNSTITDKGCPLLREALTVPSSLQSKNITQTLTKKRKISRDKSATLTSKNEVNDCSDSTGSDVISFVQINVPKSKVVTQHAQSSTEELENDEWLVPSRTEKDVDRCNDYIHNKVPRNCENNSRPKKKREGSVKKVNSSSVKLKSPNAEQSFEKTDCVKVPKDKVQVEVLSIKESGTSKVIECQTVEGVTPTRTFKLHYPPNYPLPQTAKYLYIPQTLLHPLNLSTSPMGPSLASTTSTSTKKQTCIVPSSKVPFVSNQKPNFEGDQEVNNDMELSLSSEKADVLEIVSQYSQQSERGTQRLRNIIHKSHQQHISAIKDIQSFFQKLQQGTI